MPQGSRARSSQGRSRPSSGGRYAGGSGGGGGGGTNPVPIIIAGVALVAIVGLFFLFSKKDKPKDTPLSAPPPVVAPPVGPKPPEPPKKAPLPTLPQDVVNRAKNLIPEFKEVNKKGTTLYDEALKAKEAGDADTWQAKMEEARELMKIARDKWIVIEEEVQSIVDKAMPLQGWTDASAHEALFDLYMKEEARQVRTLIDDPLSRMAKTGRSR